MPETGYGHVELAGDDANRRCPSSGSVHCPLLLDLLGGQREARLGGPERSEQRARRVVATAGPCLKPWPEPPPTSQTFSNSGWRSMRKSPFEVFSYWQTRLSTSGAWASAGKRRTRKSREAAIPAGGSPAAKAARYDGRGRAARGAVAPRCAPSGTPYSTGSHHDQTAR